MGDRSSKKTVPKSIVMLGVSPAGRPGIGMGFTLSRTPDSYWPSWLVSLAGGCSINHNNKPNHTLNPSKPNHKPKRDKKQNQKPQPKTQTKQQTKPETRILTNLET